MRVLGWLSACLMVSLLAGCDAYHAVADKEAMRFAGAEALDDSYRAAANVAAQTAVEVGSSDAKSWIGAAASDSLRKCQAFIGRVTVGRIVPDLTLDVAALGLAGAATISEPIRVAKTLAALAGISTGTRAAIDTDVFAQNTAPVIVQKIQQTYYGQMKDFLEQIRQAGTVNVSVEYGNLLYIHSQCSLPLAVAAIGNNLTVANTPVATFDGNDLRNGALILDPGERAYYLISVSGAQMSYVTWPLGHGPTPPTALPAAKNTDAGTLAKHFSIDGAILAKPGV